jgi:hypothetical protein
MNSNQQICNNYRLMYYIIFTIFIKIIADIRSLELIIIERLGKN